MNIIEALNTISEQLESLQMIISLHNDSQYSNEICGALSDMSETLKEVDDE